MAASSHGPAFSYHGGATVIMGPPGDVRYAIVKSVVGDRRVERRRRFLASAWARPFWDESGGRYEPRGIFFRLVHPMSASTAA